MPQISLITEDIHNAAKQLEAKAGEMEAAVQAADSAISPLRGFKSDRIARDLDAWDQIKTTFKQTLEQLVADAKELAAAAADNEAANR